MKKLFLVLSVFGLFATGSASATTIVNVEVLNIRSCAGTNCNIVGKLSRYDKVIVEKYSGEWAKVKSSKGNGFVIRTSLRVESYNLGITGEDVGAFLLIIFGIAIGLLVLFAPSLVARNNKNGNKIFWINLLLFWIPFVWLILLIAALLGEQKETNKK